jgi:hypothetical protein
MIAIGLLRNYRRSREGGSPGFWPRFETATSWIPACAGMTILQT